MRHFKDFEIFIFDCDGVILDSNNLKIQAMSDVVSEILWDTKKNEECIEYFKNNFGVSRSVHIKKFVEEIYLLKNQEAKSVFNTVYEKYSEKCIDLYENAVVIDGFENFILNLNGKKFVASGSDGDELNLVFKKKGLDKLFDGIYGSPEKKTEIVESLLKKNRGKAVLFGDSVSDFDAAVKNDIEFIAFIPFSNVKEELSDLAKKNGSDIWSTWI